jgi:polysaccharide deacetylase 2 family uncharacterized protein YibQ
MISGTNGGILAAETAYISIIIDDIGYSKKRGRRVIQLPGAITCSVLPYARHSASLARRAHIAGKEVMLHLPMENVRGHNIGPDGLTANLSKVEFIRNLDKALADIPFVQGINNHMGSFLTQQPQQMGWLMDEMLKRDMFFIDSRTTPHSVASRIARDMRVFESGRDIFLDNTRNVFAIDHSFRHLIRIAKKTGTAIAIGHPYTSTLDYLEMVLPLLDEMGVKLVSASELIELKSFPRSDLAMHGPVEFSTDNLPGEAGGIAE